MRRDIRKAAHTDTALVLALMSAGVMAVEAMTFHLPVHVGDEVSCYCEVVKVGRTSMTIRVETWTRKRESAERIKVTQGVFTYVAIGTDRRPRPVDAAGAS